MTATETAAADGLAPASRVKSSASAVSTSAFNYPAGHLGHLSTQQNEALQKFKTVLIERGLLNTGPPPSHDDQTLLYVPAAIHQAQHRANQS